MSDNFIFQSYVNDLFICDQLIDYHKTNKQHPGQSGGGVNKCIKDSLDVMLNPKSNLFNSYVSQLKVVVKDFLIKYPSCDWTSHWGFREYIQIQKYNPGGGYHEYHCERDSGKVPMSKRHLVFMTYLNDVTDKGQTEFMYQQVAIEPKKGLTLIWPVDWTHTHRGITSPSQTKYVVTGWLSFVD
jgi:prolyl 4-hydroxylase